MIQSIAKSVSDWALRDSNPRWPACKMKPQVPDLLEIQHFPRFGRFHCTQVPMDSMNFHRFAGLLLQKLLQAATSWIFPARRSTAVLRALVTMSATQAVTVIRAATAARAPSPATGRGPGHAHRAGTSVPSLPGSDAGSREPEVTPNGRRRTWTA